MTAQREAMTIVLQKLKEDLGHNITIGQLPSKGGISAEITGGGSLSRTLNLQHGQSEITVLFLCKNTDQAVAYDTLCEIGEWFNRLMSLPGEVMEVTGAKDFGVGLVGKDGDYYIYELTVKVSINF